MNKMIVSLFLLVGGIITTGCGYKHRTLVNPEVEILNTHSLDQVKASVRKTLSLSGWKIEEETAGATLASIQVDPLFAEIKVEYSEKQVIIRYVDSHHLNYKMSSKNQETIHSRYLRWVNRLARLLNQSLNGSPVK